MQLVSQAPAGTTFDDMAISPGGPFAAGPYVMDATNGRVLRIVSGGSPVAVITGLKKPQSIGFHSTTGALMIVCDGKTVLWVNRAQQRCGSHFSWRGGAPAEPASQTAQEPPFAVAQALAQRPRTLRILDENASLQKQLHLAQFVWLVPIAACPVLLVL